MKVLVLNGPNLGLLGTREPGLYGRDTLPDIMEGLRKRAAELGLSLDWMQSDDEGELVRRIGAACGQYDGLILNPAAYTHTSVALRDALQAVPIPCVEVHLSNVHAREDFRQRSLTAGACVGQICGFGAVSYRLALEALAERLRRVADVGT